MPFDLSVALDLSTLFVVSACITVLLGLFLLCLWLQDRTMSAFAWWGAAYLLGGQAVALWMIGDRLPSIWSEELPPLLLFACGGMIWSGARKFHKRRVLPLAAVAGSLIWLVASLVPQFDLVGPPRVALSSLIICSYTFLTAIELKRERRKARAARLRAIILSLLHGAVFLLPILMMTIVPEDAGGLSTSAFAMFSLLLLIYAIGTAFIVVVMAKEQSVALLRTAALCDPLTGVFNRRGFVEAAEKLIASEARNKGSVTVLMFDLDHFKSINDRFGHHIGDEALCAFARTVVQNMRADDIIGRLGGEEFAAILPGGMDVALIVAERVRAAFEISGKIVADLPVEATVSAGAACTAEFPITLSHFITRADAALYRAKQSGRNRVAVDDASMTVTLHPPVQASVQQPADSESAARQASLPQAAG